MAEAPALSAADLGERVSLLYSIEGDPQHPFSEVTGVLLRVSGGDGPDARYSVMRRSGEVVEVERASIVKLRMLAAGSGPLRVPPSWQNPAG
ncbi:MAG TPA: hypothetical protein VHJ78_03900 [Actinomycetota bacterium]|nr:hypothetical protein [Actinomycetota bacterium]